MPLVVAGLSHKTAPVELREKIAFSSQRVEEILNALKGASAEREVALLSTCNRTEIYLASKQRPDELRRWCVQVLKEQLGDQKVEDFVYVKTGREMVDHLFKVASGLDSMVLGENEILKQVKDAYQLSLKTGLTGKVLNVLFQRALYVGKLVRSRTGIGHGRLSVGSVAVSLAEKIFGDLSRSAVLIFGAGKMAEVSAKYLLGRSVKRLLVANRTYENAVALAQKFDAEPLSFADGMDALSVADIVITSMSAPEPILTRELMSQVMAKRHNRSLFLIDIAVPRNVDAAAHQMDNVYLYDIDDLQTLVQENARGRSGEVEKASLIVAAKSEEFEDWIRSLESGNEKSLKHDFEADDRRAAASLEWPERRS